ncbi:MAG: DUF1376 domain-containing protein [Patescibacteria group bacterium]|nr:DUF1376 domain-containing protein [Patescibacteria group bacterium]
MNFYKRFIGDIQRDTGHLSLAEMGAYDRLLDHYYATEEKLPSDIDACYRIARAMTKDERKAVDSVVRQYFILDSDGYSQNRAEQEIAEAQPKISAARTNGAKGGRPKKNPTETQEKPNGFSEKTQQKPNSKASQSQIPEPEKTTPTPIPPSRTSALDGFDQFWAAYPKKVGKEAAFKAWKKLKKPSETLQAILLALAWQKDSAQWRKNSGQFIPNPATYLTQGRWMDERPMDGIDEWLQEQNTIEGDFHVTQ